MPMPKNPYLRLLILVGVILVIPLIAMQITDEVNWATGDFIIGGLLLFAAGSGVIFVSSFLRNSNFRWPALVLLAIAFLVIWAELAVGIFD